MPRFIEGQDRHQVTLLPESLDDLGRMGRKCGPKKKGLAEAKPLN